MSFAAITTWARQPQNAPTSELHAEKTVNSDCIKLRHVVCRGRDTIATARVALRTIFMLSTELQGNIHDS